MEKTQDTWFQFKGSDGAEGVCLLRVYEDPDRPSSSDENLASKQGNKRPS